MVWTIFSNDNTKPADMLDVMRQRHNGMDSEDCHNCRFNGRDTCRTHLFDPSGYLRKGSFSVCATHLGSIYIYFYRKLGMLISFIIQSIGA